MSSKKSCPVAFTNQVIGGKWRAIVLYHIYKGNNRFGLLIKSVDGISKQVLTNELRNMEEEGIIMRRVYKAAPPKTEYSFTARGKTLVPILEAMALWGSERMRMY